MAKRSNAPRSTTKTGRAATSAVSGGGNVRKRVHDLTLRAVRDNDLSFRELPGLAKEVAHGAAAGLDNAVPRSSRNVLRQVVDGLTDAVAAAAKATRATASVASERGAAFVKRDVHRTAKDLRKLEDEVLNSLRLAGRSLTGAVKAELDSIVDEASRAGTKISAAADTARKAADGRLPELGRETVGASARAARSAVGTLLHGAGGLLEGLADAVTKSSPRTAPAKKARTTAKTAKKTAVARKAPRRK